jgi:hypothetical protein
MMQQMADTMADMQAQI